MFLARKAPYFKRGILMNLFDCELCLGVWVYSLLSLVFGLYLPNSMVYIPVLSEFISGAVLSVTMWLLTDGWNSKFRIMYLE